MNKLWKKTRSQQQQNGATGCFAIITNGVPTDIIACPKKFGILIFKRPATFYFHFHIYKRAWLFSSHYSSIAN